MVFPPAVFGGCPPPVLLSRVAASFHCLMCSLFPGVPAPGRPPGHRHGSAWPGPAAADQCSVLNGPGLPPRAGSEYEGDLHAYGAGRSGANFERPAPAQPPLQLAKLRPDSLTGLPRALLGGLLCTQAEDMAQGVPGAARAVHCTAFAWARSMLEARPGKLLSPSGKPLSHYERLATLKALVNKVFAAQHNMQHFLEE